MRARAPIAILLVLSASACASLRSVPSTPFDGEGGAVRVRVFADDEARGNGEVLSARIVGELERRGGSDLASRLPVARALLDGRRPRPGRYRVTFAARLDGEGAVEALERTVTREVKVVESEVAQVELVLDHVSPAMVAAGAVGIVVAAVLLHELLDDLDLPAPPPPPAWALETAFWVTLDLASAPEEPWVQRARGPQVTSTFPVEGDLVVAARPRVVLSLSEPLDPRSVAPDAIRVTTAEGIELAGDVSYDRRHWWLVWEPAADLPRDQSLEVVVSPDLSGADGEPLAGADRFTFSTAR